MRNLAARLFFAPGDWLVNRTNQRQRLAVACWNTLFWLPPGPGFWLWLMFIHAVWFLGVMSIVALQLTALTMAAAETPVEQEGQDS